MANCVTCKARCENAGQHRVKTDCISYIPKDYPKPMTNYDRLVSKTPEELARYYAKRIVRCYGCEAVTEDDCFECQLDWLKSPVEVDE